MSKKPKIGTWTEGRLSVEYERVPGEPRTMDDPGSEDEIKIISIMVDGDDIGRVVDVLNTAGINVIEALERLVMEGTAR